MDASDRLRVAVSLHEQLCDINVRTGAFGKSREFKRLGEAAICHAAYPSSETFAGLVEALSQGDESIKDAIFRRWGIRREGPEAALSYRGIWRSNLPLFEE